MTFLSEEIRTGCTDIILTQVGWGWQVLGQRGKLRYGVHMTTELGDSPPHQIKANVAANVAALREERGWSKPELARRLAERGWEARRQTVHKIETLDRHVAAEELWELAQCFGVDVSRLLQRGESQLLELENLDSQIIHAEDELAGVLVALTQQWLDADELLQSIPLGVVDDPTNAGRASMIRGALERARRFRDGGVQYVSDRAARQAIRQLDKHRLELVAAGAPEKMARDIERRIEIAEEHLEYLGRASET